MKYIITFIVLFSLQLFAQPWDYNFGTGTGTFNTPSTFSETFLPTAPSGTARVYIGDAGGQFELSNPGIAGFGTGSELLGIASSGSSDGSINKFSIYDISSPTPTFYLRFSVRLDGGEAGSEWVLFLGKGSNPGHYYMNDVEYSSGDIFCGIRWEFTGTSAINTFVNINNSWGSSLPWGIVTGTNYVFEIFANNTGSAVSYIYGGSEQVAAYSYDLWIDGVKIRDDDSRGIFTQGREITSFLFMGRESTSNGATIYIDDIFYSNEIEDVTPGISGAIAGTVSVNGNGLGAVEVELTDADGLAIEGIDPIFTNGDGAYEFADLDPADYQVGIIVPLGYALDSLEVNPALVTVLPDETTIANFHLVEVALSNMARGRPYWKRQFSLHIRGRGWRARETEAELLSYIDGVHQYYTPHFDIFDGLTTFEEWKDVLRYRFHHSKKLERAKAQLAALVLNFTSLKISQNEIVTYDNRTAGDVLTYCSVLISNPDATDDELRLAKRLARKVNRHRMIGAGIVPESGILYKGMMENIDWNFGLPTEYTLSQNYPNPFNPSTTIQYQIPQSGNVTLKVYDVIGNEVALLVDEMKQQGNYQVSFDASALSSGIYIYRLIASDFVETKKMILLK